MDNIDTDPHGIESNIGGLSQLTKFNSMLRNVFKLILSYTYS